MHFPRYKSLAKLRNYALEIDSRYWENKEFESIGSNPWSSGSNTTSGNRSMQNQGSSNQGSNNSNTGKKNKSCHSNNSGSNNAANNSAKNSTDTTIKLGKDGKLLPEECQCRINQGLCLLCRQKGHLVKECPKATPNTSNSSKSKGQAAKTLVSGFLHYFPLFYLMFAYLLM